MQYIVNSLIESGHLCMKPTEAVLKASLSPNMLYYMGANDEEVDFGDFLWPAGSSNLKMYYFCGFDEYVRPTFQSYLLDLWTRVNVGMTPRMKMDAHKYHLGYLYKSGVLDMETFKSNYQFMFLDKSGNDLGEDWVLDVDKSLFEELKFHKTQ